MMDTKQFSRRLIIVILIVIAGFLLQTSVFSHFELAGVTPNILIIITSTFGFMKGRKKGMLIGFFCGIVLDLFFGFYFGTMALIYMYIGYINGFFKKLFFGDDLRLPLILIGTSDLIYGITIYLFIFAYRQKYDFGFYLLNIILPEVVYTVVVSIFVYYVILHINNYVDNLDRRGSGRLDGKY